MKRILYTLLSVLVFISAFFSQSQIALGDALSVTVTPPLIQITIAPGESWQSVLKIVNSNTRDVTYYSQVVDMQANGESGQSKFIPLIGPPDPALANAELARWMSVPSQPVTIKAGKSADIPFSVHVPQNAEPGGHYAAILIGTQPLGFKPHGTQLSVSTYVSSLVFARIKGDVRESARIREFSSDKSLYQSPKADFVLRFENTGNTHLKPEGDITIYNMWGKARGKVLFNQDSDFGNVLPQTIRRFQFSWSAEDSVFDIGRYSAVVTLTFGEDSKKNISATTYFWIVPIVPVSMTLGIILIFLTLLTFFIRRYVRRALALERERLGLAPQARFVPAQTAMLETFIEPIREGVVDLRKVTRTDAPREVMRPVDQIPAPEISFTTAQFVRKYRLFFAFLFILLLVIIVLWIYLDKVLVPQRNYNIQSVISQIEGTSSSQ